MKQKFKKLVCSSLILLSSLVTQTLTAQTYCSGSSCELVCNGSFETTSATPPGMSTPVVGIFISYATGWTDVGGTPDLFSTSSPNPPSFGYQSCFIPCNTVGYQFAHTGNLYAGLLTSQDDGTPQHHLINGEFIHSGFASTMVAGKLYEVSLWVSRADVSRNAISALGIWLKGSPGTDPADLNCPVASLNNDAWTKITFSYCADGTESGLIIGGTSTSQGTTITPPTPCSNNVTVAGDRYIYIDDVSVKEAKFTVASDTVCLNTAFTVTAVTQSTACTVDMGNFTYTWDHGDGTSAVNTGTVNTSTHSYTAYGLYTASLSISTGSCSVTYTYNILVPNVTIAVTSNSTSICNGITSFTATPSPAGTYTVSWGLHDASTYTVIPTSSYTITGGTGLTPTIDFASINQNVYVYVTLTSTMGCQYRDSIFLPSCCPTATNVIKYTNTTYNTTTALASATGTNAIALSGTITVNSGGNLIISSKDVRMDPYTKIVLNGTGRITLTSDYIHGCNFMWDGIYANTTGLVSAQTVRFEDAQRVIVDSLGTASLNVVTSYFNKNYIGIAIKAAKTSTSTVTIKNNFFSCSSIATTGSVPYIATTANLTNAGTLGALTSTVLIAPYSTLHSYCGIFLTGASHTGKTNSQIAIGTTTGLENVFDKMQIGLFSYASSSLLQNNVFQNIKSSISPTAGGTNAGVALLGPVFGGAVGLMNVGGSLSLKNTFRDNDYGIYNWYQSGLLATYNTFSVQTTGVYVNANDNGSTVNLQYNNFYKNGVGVNFYDNTEINADVKDNNFDNSASAIGTYADNFAIRCTEVTLATGSPYPDYNIYNNNITGYYNGINALNTLSVNIEDNEVHMRQDNTSAHWQSGINIEGSNASDINNNIVDMSSASTGYWQSGISAHTNTTPKIHCNSINNLDMSIRIDHDNTTASNDGVRSNYMQNATDFGIWLVNGGELGNQGGSTGTNSSDNVWATTCGTYVYSQNSSNPSTDIFYTRVGGGYDLPASEVGKDASASCNKMFGTNSAAAGTGTTCIANASTPSNTKMAGAGALAALVQRGEEVAFDYNQVTNFHANSTADLNAPDDLENNVASTKAIKRRALLSNIMLQQIDVQDSPELTTFMTRVKYENTGLLFAVDSLIHHAEKDNAQIAIAQNANAAIAPTNKVEKSQQAFNELYLSYLAQHKKLNASDFASMEAIAIQCPNFYGTAVYQARALLFDLNSQQYRSECENVAPNASSQKRMAGKQADVIGLNLFPNPANTAVYINTGNYGTVDLKLYSIMGNLVLDKTVADNEKTDIDKLSNGIYIYKLYHNDAELIVGKLIISH